MRPLSYSLPGTISKEQYTELFGSRHATIDMEPTEAFCDIGEGVKKCYREIGRELWIEPLERTYYSVHACGWFYCTYVVEANTYGRNSIPLKGLIDHYNITNERCFNHHDLVTGFVARLTQAWTSTLTVHIKYQVTEEENIDVETKTFAVQLDDGSCDMVNVYTNYAFGKAIIFSWFKSLALLK
ncbi:hypothetical protein DSO57_1033896 [Entomophthora muscae]|uniref:Uncharacterized protein n=1 Tax=Entomophthora muscae TaxID=34485 RepID=A0ACC2SCN2_9FUNG|nr:hypothetical protein DSO57_1033896 [Entomophthora muscae]